MKTTCLILLLVATVALASRESNFQAFKAKLSNYDKDLRPAGVKNPDLSKYGNTTTVEIKNTSDPVIVEVNTFVRYIGEINDDTKDYKLQLTLRQYWRDPRLAYSADKADSYVTLTDDSLIWTPDLFFSNEKEGHINKVMKSNELLRIKPNGDITYSVRLTLTLTCFMDLTKFPMDKQICSLRIASYAYTADDIVFVWRPDHPVQVVKHLDAPPFILLGFSTDNCNSQTNTGVYSCLKGSFLFVRALSTWVFDAYLPLALLVIISWIPFYLHERLYVYRIFIDILIFIATIFQAARVSASGPVAGYARAIDIWTNWTLFLVFLALVEQVVVNFVVRCKCNEADKETPASAEEGMAMAPLMDSNGTDGITEADPTKPAPTAPKAGPKPNLIKQWLSKYSVARRIDIICRIVFPVVFVILCICYAASFDDYEGMRSLTGVTKVAYN